MGHRRDAIHRGGVTVSGIWLAGKSASARLSAERVVASGLAALVRAAAAEEDLPPARLPDELAMPLLNATGAMGVEDAGAFPDPGLGLRGWLEVACQLNPDEWPASVGAVPAELVAVEARFV